MSENNEEIHCILKFLYKKGRMPCKPPMNEYDAVSVRVAQQWFACLRSGNLEISIYTDGIMSLPEKCQKVVDQIKDMAFQKS